MNTDRNKFGFIVLRIFLVVAILLCQPAKEIFAGENPVKNKKHWIISLSLTPFYDSNILKYSEKYIERFKNRKDEGRFHIDTIDDLVFSYSLDITYSREIIGKLRTSLGAGYDSDAYSYNPIKTWGRYNLFFRQFVNESTFFSFSYSYFPKFYVRHFRDEDWVKYYGYTPETFKPYEFSKDDFSFQAQHRFGWETTKLRAYFSFMKYFLNSPNTEYDSNDFLYGVKIFQSLTDKLDINFGYYYITSDAKGYDEPGENKETSDDSDATNYEHVFSGGVDWKLPRILSLNNELSIDVHYRRAFYTTDHYLELDPLHAGRYDYNYRLFIDYKWNVLNNFSVTAFYNWMGRESSTSADENIEYVSNEKDYTQFRLGIKFNYLVKF